MTTSSKQVRAFPFRGVLVFVLGLAAASCSTAHSMSPNDCEAIVCGKGNVCAYRDDLGVTAGECICRDKAGDCPASLDDGGF